MGLFWNKDASKSQKIVNLIFFVMSIGPIYVFFNHNYVTESHISKLAVYISLALTFLTIVIMVFLYARDIWKPTSYFYKVSKIKKFFIITLAPLLPLSLFWVNLGVVGPQLYTSYFGTKVVKSELVSKDRVYSRRKCDYQLKPKSVDVMFFWYCISENQFNSFPDGEVKAEMTLKKSLFGYTVEQISLVSNKR